jgi:hypothetical protein
MLHANTTAWRAQQRHRITHLVNHPSGTRNVIVEDEGYLGAPVASMREFTTAELVEKYANISFTGQNDKPPFVSRTLALALIVEPGLSEDSAGTTVHVQNWSET